MYILSVVDFWVCAKVGKSDEVRHDETLTSAELPQNQIWIDDVGRDLFIKDKIKPGQCNSAVIPCQFFIATDKIIVWCFAYCM